jgi:hypothetical protein
MAAPSQMFENFLDPIKGWWDWACLNYVAKKASTISWELPAGRCVSLNATGQFTTGVTLGAMPMFIFQASDAFDVQTPSGTTAAGTFVSQPILPVGDMMALVGSGSFELSTTEFNKARTYTRNQYLTALPNDATPSVGGVLTNVTAAAAALVPYVNPIVGVVSGGRSVNEYNVPTLEFWTVYLPGTV